ncbi:MAG: universal stress protein [Spirochaetales bacterium]|uniref:Universal stress protein n=1 Tax=Candidatus Thalassospirochaeta sargassi TaxID=3119039 RepID=A0AAJ1IFK9_9SPIO|nr:universal stress protein [Spirochaetales bacterium]
MVKRILIAIDDQAPDACLVGKGIELARQLDAELGLTDIARLSVGYIEAGIYPTDLEDIDRQRAEKTVERIKEQYPDIDFAEFESVGDPVEELRTIITDWKPDMLVVGHHKHSIIQRLSENNKERRIINQLNIPVVVFPCDS